MNDSSRRRVRLARRFSWLVVGALTVAALVPGPVSAINGSDPAPNANAVQTIPWQGGDVACLEGTGTVGAFRINSPTDGVYDISGTNIGTDPTDPSGIIILDVSPDVDPTSFSWAFTDTAKHDYDMSAVMVKGGPTSVVVYFYADSTDDSDTNLVAADNDGAPYGVSHIDFCLNRKGAPLPTPTPTPEPTPTPTPEPTPTPTPNPTPTPTPPPNPTPTPTPPPNPTPTPTPVPTPTPTPVPTPTPTPEPTPTPTGEVAGETGAPEVTLPPTDSLSGGNQGPEGDNWRLIVLAMAGILAATLLLTPTEASRKRR